MEIGAIFASYCSLAALAELLGDGGASVYDRFQVHREIGMAVGILMGTTGVSSGEAYHRLRAASREMRRSLPHTAGQVIRDGRLPD